MTSFEWNFSVPLGHGGEGEKNKAFFQCRVTAQWKKAYGRLDRTILPASEKERKKLFTVATPTTTGVFIKVLLQEACTFPAYTPVPFPRG